MESSFNKFAPARSSYAGLILFLPNPLFLSEESISKIRPLAYSYSLPLILFSQTSDKTAKMLGVIQYSILTIFWLPIAAAALYGVGLAIYRLFLSPLAKFPGPKIAALTRKYESYYEVYRNYEYIWKIKELHEKYGELLLHSLRLYSLG